MCWNDSFEIIHPQTLWVSVKISWKNKTLAKAMSKKFSRNFSCRKNSFFFGRSVVETIHLFLFGLKFICRKNSTCYKSHVGLFSNVENFHRLRRSFECRKNQPSFLLFLRCGISSTLYLRGWIFSNSVWNFYDAIFCCRNFSVEIPEIEIFTLWNVEKILSWKKAPVEKIPSKLILFNLSHSTYLIFYGWSLWSFYRKMDFFLHVFFSKACSSFHNENW